MKSRLTKLGTILEQQGILQRDLAKAVNIYPRRVSRLVSGKSIPRPEEARDISRALGVSVESLFGAAPLEVDGLSEDSVTAVLERLVNDPDAIWLAYRLLARIQSYMRPS